MISIDTKESLKAIAELQADTIPGGALYLIIEGDTFTWRKASKIFDLNIFNVGEKISANSIAGRAMKENRTITQEVPRSLYGIRLKTIAEPLVNEEGEAVGVFSIVYPQVHPVVKSFNDFAPILAEMFPEGAFLFMSDLQKIIRRHPSKKFDMPSIQLEYELLEGDVASKAIKKKEPVFTMLDSSRFGVPVLVTSYPLFDEISNEVVATLGVVIPKTLASNLREMSGNLESGLSGIASAIEELAASASTIHANEQDLNKEIVEIIALSESIIEISTFIKKIGNETNMLGLNASIEAARAGEAGRGFGVVANEIRKLSEQSRSTVPKIKELTDSIKLKVDTASEKCQGSLSSSQEQAAATEEITASIQEITHLSAQLNEMAKHLI